MTSATDENTATVILAKGARGLLHELLDAIEFELQHVKTEVAHRIKEHLDNARGALNTHVPLDTATDSAVEALPADTGETGQPEKASSGDTQTGQGEGETKPADSGTPPPESVTSGLNFEKDAAFAEQKQEVAPGEVGGNQVPLGTSGAASAPAEPSASGAQPSLLQDDGTQMNSAASPITEASAATEQASNSSVRAAVPSAQ